MLFDFLKRFRRGEDGSLSVEAALIFPMLIWCYLAMHVYFDAYRQNTIAERATYTVADMVSRFEPGTDPATDNINNAYVNSMRRMLNFLTTSPNSTRMRLSIVEWDEDNSEHIVFWSRSRGGVQRLNAARIGQVSPRIPVMTDGTRVIVFEAWIDYQPAFNIGLDPFTNYKVVVTRPRPSGGQICFENNDLSLEGAGCAPFGT